MFIDTHCHLTFPDFNDDRVTVIGNAKKAGVKQFVNPGVDPMSSRLAVELAAKNPGVIFAAIGFHPYEAQHLSPLQAQKELAQLFASPLNSKPQTLNPASPAGGPIVAIGECGLDYHQYKGENGEGKKQNQRLLFEEQLRFALAHDLPVIMHCRDAYEDFFTVLDSLPSMPRGVIHCFSGGLQELRMAQERTFFTGIDGNVTYSKQLMATVPNIPLTMLLLETDTPYLTPVPHRGTRNEPKYIPLIAKAIADLYKKDIAEIEEHTTKNAQALFRMV